MKTHKKKSTIILLIKVNKIQTNIFKKNVEAMRHDNNGLFRKHCWSFMELGMLSNQFLRTVSCEAVVSSSGRTDVWQQAYQTWPLLQQQCSQADCCLPQTDDQPNPVSYVGNAG